MIRKVLVIRFRRLGDAVISSALCKALHGMFPGVEVHYVLNEAMASLFEGQEGVDRVIPFSERENHDVRLYTRKVWRLMRQERYDAIIDTRATLKTMWFSLFSLPTRYRVGWAKWYNRWWLTCPVARDEAGGRDELRRTLDLLRPLEREGRVAASADFALRLPADEVAAFRAYMEERGVDFSRPVVVCAPLTRVRGKEWAKERMGALLARLAAWGRVQLVINYAPDEREEARQLFETMGCPSGVFLDVEAGTPRALAAMLLNADFFFGNEGGARHLAQALGVPAFAIYPPGVDMRQWLPLPGPRNQGISPVEWLPEGTGRRLSREEVFSLLTVDRVWERLRPMLEVCLRR